MPKYLNNVLDIIHSLWGVQSLITSKEQLVWFGFKSSVILRWADVHLMDTKNHQ